jgi:hypothetical protein
MQSTTRRRLTWTSLTPQSAFHTGDFVEVWDHDDDESRRGVFLGIHERFGESFAMIATDEHGMAWGWALDERVTIKLLRESASLTLHAADPQRRWTWLETGIYAATFIGLSVILTLLRVWR